jgi:hypothetical protein
VVGGCSSCCSVVGSISTEGESEGASHCPTAGPSSSSGSRAATTTADHSRSPSPSGSTLRGIPAGSRLRRYLFERLCLVNTILFAGFDGFQVKLWMVDPNTADYAGLCSWRSAGEADIYARYITGVLRPLSVNRSVGCQVLAGTSLKDYLAGSESGRGKGPVTEQAMTHEASGPTPVTE